jgi:hypothetical protein
MVHANTTGGRLGDVPRYGVCSDNLQDFLVQGAILHRRHPGQLYRRPKISIDRERWRLTVLFAMPTAVALSQWTGVLGCECPISSSVMQKIMPSEGTKFSFSRGCDDKAKDRTECKKCSI